MGTHESSVNYQNLIQDLAEMYPFEIPEVVLIELVANSLDAGATLISIDYASKDKVLVVSDNGKGMTESQFNEYHDFAAGLKTRGTGIGFAGVGAKVSFNIADRVITETHSDTFSGGSDWYLRSKNRLLWDEISPTNLSGRGTRVEVRLKADAKIAYSSTEELISLLRIHYLPLFDKKFLSLYQDLGFYSSDLKFQVNRQALTPGNLSEALGLGNIREFFPTRGGRRVGYGIFGLAPTEYPVAPNISGAFLCTHGKVIKADLFNQFPSSLGSKLFGLVEVPGFVNFLTTAKTDFIRGRGKHLEFERLYGPVREEFKTWLAELGVQSIEFAGTDEAIKLERELKRLINDIPELGDFFGFRDRKQVLKPDDTGAITASPQEGTETTFPVGQGEIGVGLATVDIGDQPGEALVEDKEKGTDTAHSISRHAKRGPKIAFADDPKRVEMAWVDGNTIVINSGLTSYKKVRDESLARRLYSMIAIGSAVQRFLASGDGDLDLTFLDRVLWAWGKK